jgi:hypothetical protein
MAFGDMMNRSTFWMCLVVTLCVTVGSHAQSGGPFVAGLTAGPVLTSGVVSAETRTGDIVVVGTVNGPHSWIAPTGYQKLHAGGNDAFVAVLDKTLTKVKAFTYLGGLGNDEGHAVAVQSDGTIVVAGATESTDMPTTVGSVCPNHSVSRDGFIIGLTPMLDSVVFGTYVNGSKDDEVLDITLDADNSIYVTGSTTSPYGFPLASPIQHEHIGGKDGFILVMNSRATQLVFGTYYGSDGEDVFTAISTDETGGIYVGGKTGSASFPTFPKIKSPWWWQQSDRPYDWTYGGGLSDGVYLCLAPNGSRLIVATYIGGNGADEVMDVIPMKREVYIVGTTSSTNLEMSGGLQDELRGPRDGFIVGLDMLGRTRLSSSYFGGSGDDTMVGGIRVNASDVLIWGASKSADFRAMGYRTRGTILGAQDGYFAVMNTGQVVQASTFGGDRFEELSDVLITSDGGIVLVGITNSQWLPLDNGTQLRPDVGADEWSAFIAKYQRGGIDLSSPSGTVAHCASTPLRFRWTATEMQEGDTYTVSVSDDGVTWTKLAGPTTDRYIEVTTIPSSLYGRPLHYRVMSSRGHISLEEGTITFVPDLVVTRQLDEQHNVCTGSSITATYSVEGAPAVIRWYVNGTLVSEGASDTYTFTTTSSAIVHATATSSCGQTVRSVDMKVNIDQQPLVTTVTDDVIVDEGKSFLVGVTATGGGLSYQWFHDGQMLEGKTQASLTRTATLQSAGLYKCTITNSCGTATSNTIEVIVQPVMSVHEGIVSSSMQVQGGRDGLDVFLQTYTETTRLRLITIDGRSLASTMVRGIGDHHVRFAGPLPFGLALIVAEGIDGSTERQPVLIVE